MAVSHSILPSVLFYLLPSSSLSTSSSTYSTTPSPPLRNTSLYPACMEDTDCENDRRCFQYMCYPWQTSTGFRWCSKREDCAALLPEEGGDHRDGSCFKHEDSANINFGICLPRSQMIRCKSHRDCPGGKAPLGRKGSLRCTNGWCGDPKYFEALKQRPCKKDQECERLQTGEMCCYDFSSPQGWQAGKNGQEWQKKCCDNPSGNPIIRPPENTSPNLLSQVLKIIIISNQKLPPPAELSNPGALVGLHGHGGVRGAHLQDDAAVGVVHGVPDDHHDDVEPEKRSSHVIVGILEPPSSVVITCLPLASDQPFDILVIST